MEQSKAPWSADMALGLVYVIVALVIGWLIGRRSRRRPVAAGGIGSTLIVAYALWAFFGPCEGDDCTVETGTTAILVIGMLLGWLGGLELGFRRALRTAADI